MHTKIGKARGQNKWNFKCEGSLVINEDEKAIDALMKREYVLDIPQFIMIERRAPEFVNFDKLKNIVLITDGVCSGKLPCLFAEIDEVRYVLKPMPKSLNEGKDYAYVDAQKQKMGLNSVDVTLIRINKFLKRFVDIGENKRYEFIDSPGIFARMKVINNVGDLGKQKELLNDETVFDETLKLRLLRGLFRSSDNILRNILVESGSHQLFGIDENDIFGKRAKIFNKKEPMKRSAYFTREKCSTIIFQIISLGESFIADLGKFGLSKHKTVLRERLAMYEQLVFDEIDSH
jgi:hypothetical protein